VQQDHEKKRNLPKELCRGKPNLKPIPKFDEIPFYDENFSNKRFINWLTELEAYYYFNKISYYKKVELVAHKLSYDVREW